MQKENHYSLVMLYTSVSKPLCPTKMA